MRTLDELISSDCAFETIKTWALEAKNECLILPQNEQKAQKELVSLQISSHSFLGGVVYKSGGIIVNHGFVRIFGSGFENLQGICEFNALLWDKFDPTNAGFIVVANDILGGAFAINGGALGDDVGKIYYLAQDSLAWEGFGVSYGEFLNWAFFGDLAKFYEGFFFDGWREAVSEISYGEVFSFVPFLWAKEATNINSVSKKPVSSVENLKFTLEMMKGLKCR